MIHKTYKVTCDACNEREFNEGDLSDDDAEWHAFFNGWTSRKVANGAMWDLCPDCSKLKELP